ncbi:MAG: hypothetical protein Q8K68_01855, partial [Nitrospirota bacterium]|nr:hypothetical protein [Nitrospirota bacterium]
MVSYEDIRTAGMMLAAIRIFTIKSTGYGRFGSHNLIAHLFQYRAKDDLDCLFIVTDYGPWFTHWKILTDISADIQWNNGIARFLGVT